MDWFVACHSLLEGTMTRNRTKVWDLNYVTVIMSATTKSRDLHVTRGKRSLTEESGCLKMVLGGEWAPYLR